MVSNNKYIYTHLRKTGGTTIRKILVKFFDGNEKHKEMTNDHYIFMKGRGLIYTPNFVENSETAPTEPHKTPSEKPENTKLITSVRNPYTWLMSWFYYECNVKKDNNNPSPHEFKKWIRNNPNRYMDEFNSNMGNLDVDYFIRNENIKLDILDIMGRIGFEIDDKLIQSVMDEPDYNILSYNRNLSDHYDDELIDFVYDRNKMIFDKFNYKKLTKNGSK